VASAPAPAAAPAPVDSLRSPVVDPPESRAKGMPFGPGESLRFSIEYGIIKAGTAWLEVLPMEDYRGRTCFHLVSRAESNDFMSSIYKVRDRIDSLVDLEGLFSLRYRKHLSEGSYHKEYDVAYDPAHGRAVYADGKAFDTRPWPKDGLAAFYFVRALPLVVGHDIVIPHHSDQSSENITVKVLKKETIEVPAGKFKCIVIEPVMAEGGLFKNSGRLTIWVTDDARRMPVLMKSKIPVGSIDAVLQAYKSGGPAPIKEADSLTSPDPRPGL
jgi:hypothetical protein